jgi:hypothetical protein
MGEGDKIRQHQAGVIAAMLSDGRRTLQARSFAAGVAADRLRLPRQLQLSVVPLASRPAEIIQQAYDGRAASGAA